ncbi:MAG: LLM class flavin-dependent oxidoreductase [Acidimicrobiales bacterium]|nr:LLM class flavin-dependent oxidoreductase [Woeseia sp.]RZV36561.1 MAG: LLM class flavin-dependent oxidoreductase [Acidimicrobiales bacterium]
MSSSAVQIFSTCPQSKDLSSNQYRQQVIDVARWSEKSGCTGILVYTDNGIVDPWQVAQVIVENTETLAPLVAVQPVYMHPYTVAKKIATFGFLYNRRLWINMVAGGFRNDLLAMNDETPHDDRYLRIVEYTTIIRRLLQSPDPVSFAGKYYTVKNLKLTPTLPKDLFPGITISGSSDSGLKAAEEIDAIAVRYPKKPEEERGVPDDARVPVGVRIGIVARDSSEEAWKIALDRFPEDRKGQLTHHLAMKSSDSEWHKQLSEKPEEGPLAATPYWLGPFQNYKTFCPYLVGSYDEVSELVGGYIKFGFDSFILDIPPSYEELEHIGIVFDQARQNISK